VTVVRRNTSTKKGTTLIIVITINVVPTTSRSTHIRLRPGRNGDCGWQRPRGGVPKIHAHDLAARPLAGAHAELAPLGERHPPVHHELRGPQNEAKQLQVEAREGLGSARP